ncbi:hypothetical protein D3C79_192320 [compost metagenome]
MGDLQVGRFVDDQPGVQFIEHRLVIARHRGGHGEQRHRLRVIGIEHVLQVSAATVLEHHDVLFDERVAIDIEGLRFAVIIDHRHLLHRLRHPQESRVHVVKHKVHALDVGRHRIGVTHVRLGLDELVQTFEELHGFSGQRATRSLGVESDPARRCTGDSSPVDERVGHPHRAVLLEVGNARVFDIHLEREHRHHRQQRQGHQQYRLAPANQPGTEHHQIVGDQRRFQLHFARDGIFAPDRNPRRNQ